MKLYYPYLLALLAGFLINLSLPPFGFVYLEWVAFVPLFYSLYYLSLWEKLFVWYLFGFIILCVIVFPFIGYSLSVFLLFSIFSPFLYVFIGLINELVLGKQSKELRLLAIPILWVLVELIVVESPLALPIQISVAQYTNLAFIQIVDIFSMFGTDFFIVALNILLTYALIKYQEKNIKQSLGAAGLVIFSLIAINGYGAFQLQRHIATSSTLSMSLLQGNVTWQNQIATNSTRTIHEKVADSYISLIEQAALTHPEYIILPESGAVGYIFNVPALYQKFEAMAKKYNLSLIVEATEKEKGKTYSNVSIFTPQGGVLGSNRKTRLTHFGESDFSPNKVVHPILTPQGSLGIEVCYDACFPLISGMLTKKGAQVLIVLANDSLYGYSAIPYLHTGQAVFRAIENRKMLVEVNNSGQSGLIDAQGRILELTDYNSSKIINSQVALNFEKTIFSQYGYLALFVLMSLYALMISRRFFNEKNKR